MEPTANTVFPTTADDQGYFFDSADDQESGIITKIYDNGNKTKTATLKGGDIAVMRELTGKDTKNIARFMDKDNEKYTLSGITVATSINGKPEAIEYFENLKLKDFNRLVLMFGDLNF